MVNADAARQFHQAYLELRPELEAGKISDERWWQQLALRSGVNNGEIPEIARALDSTFELNSEGLDMAMAVIDAGYVTGVFANISPGLAQMVRERFEWLDEFAAVIFSCDIGVCKPYAEAFDVAAEALGAAPKDTVIFDPNEEFVEAAKAAGLQAYVYQSPQQVLAVLDNLKP
ncbi:phosphoglycolate phosphatase [Corynebacterium casei LMG S-19264]|uniref:Phosphoglycolate phosphatase n=1 Tax=Corynebacterium casei LMG S-19264 TaxID=1285583 RepID=A0ABN4C885_9CORY|nr:phosphoglycolate phosphatase [Corynebacterium casei LMG S-19264]